MKPDPKLIESMCFRYRHDFGLLNEMELPVNQGGKIKVKITPI